MTTNAKRLPIDIVKNILSYDNYIIRNGEVVKINKIKKLDERYKMLYYTFNGNPHIGELYDESFREIFIIIKGYKLYVFIYTNNKFSVSLVDRKDDEYDDEGDIMGTNMIGTTLYIRE